MMPSGVVFKEAPSSSFLDHSVGGEWTLENQLGSCYVNRREVEA